MYTGFALKMLTLNKIIAINICYEKDKFWRFFVIEL